MVKGHRRDRRSKKEGDKTETERKIEEIEVEGKTRRR